MSTAADCNATPRFFPGQTVHVRSAQVYTHIRTPWYIMGKTGIVERIVGTFPDAEKVAYGDPKAEKVFLYRVTFVLQAVWDDPKIDAGDTIDIEIYEKWLIAA